MSSDRSSPISSSEDEFPDGMTGSQGIERVLITGPGWPFCAWWYTTSYDVFEIFDFNAGFIAISPEQGFPQRQNVTVKVYVTKDGIEVLDRWSEEKCYQKLFNPMALDLNCKVNLGRLGIEQQESDKGTYCITCTVAYTNDNGEEYVAPTQTKYMTIE